MPRPLSRPSRPSVRIALALLLTTAGLVMGPAPAQAESRVGVANAAGDAQVDPTYATTLRVSGTGFQSIEGGHGGVYVFFGTVGSGWRPSRGGQTGQDYFYVPDSESRSNQGFQKYVAFPGSDTASSANGGTMSASGAWSTTIVVPGATFRAYDRDDQVRTVDCTRVTCGVITVGAHGVTNGRNETFTPVSVADLADPVDPAGPADPSGADTDAPGASTQAGSAAETSPGPAGSTADRPSRGKPTLRVDRGSARAGSVLAFTATGLRPGRQVAVVFDDGASGAGPFLVGDDGRLTGVLSIPADTGAGTHELRVYGIADPPSAKFAVGAASPASAVGSQADLSASTAETGLAAGSAAPSGDDTRAAVVFAGAAGLLLLLALGRLVLLGLRARGVRRAA